MRQLLQPQLPPQQPPATGPEFSLVELPVAVEKENRRRTRLLPHDGHASAVSTGAGAHRSAFFERVLAREADVLVGRHVCFTIRASWERRNLRSAAVHRLLDRHHEPDRQQRWYRRDDERRPEAERAGRPSCDQRTEDEPEVADESEHADRRPLRSSGATSESIGAGGTPE